MVELAIFDCKCKFGNVKMLARTPPNLDLYLIVNQRQMKAIDIEYNVRVGYWASRNNMQEYKVYIIVIWMFDPDFMNNLKQAPRDICG